MSILPRFLNCLREKRSKLNLEISTSLLITALRIANLGFKFILLFYLVHYFSPAEVGIYGILSCTISYCMVILGMEFYNYNFRELLAVSSLEWPKLIFNQLYFHFITYLVLLPIFSFIFLFNILEWKYIFWFYLLLVLEHICQEIYRILIIISKPLEASIVLSLRIGGWIIPFIVIIIFYTNLRNLTTICLLWTIGDFFGILLSLYYLRELNLKLIFNFPIDWRWIRKGLAVGNRFFWSTFAVMGIFTIDRYFLKYYQGNQVVGAYTFFFSLAKIMQLIGDASLWVILSPKIVSAYQNNQMSKYYSYIKELIFWTFIIVIACSLLFYLGISPLLNLLHKYYYNQFISTFWILVLAMVVLSFESIVNIILFVRKLDNLIMICSLIGFIFAITINLMLVPSYGAIGASIATLCASSILLLGKLISLARLKSPFGIRSHFKTALKR